jgi:uncharacterized protein (DUF885 family)
MGAELKSLALAMTAAGLILAGAPAALAANSADAKFEALYTKEWAWRQAEFGRIDDSEGEGARNNHLPHVDAASQARRLAYWNDVLKALAAIDPKALSPAERVNYEVYRIQVENLAADQRFKTYEEPFNSDSSFWADIAPSSGRSWRAAAEYQAYLGRLHDLPRYFDENIANMRAGIARGYTVPRASIEGRDQSIADIAAETDPETNVFYAPFKSMPASIPADQQAALKAEAAKAIREDVVPAHQKLLAFMRTEYFPHATQILSSEAYPDGKAYYQHMIHEYTTLDLTPDQIHAIGLSEVARIHAEMLAVMAETGFKGTFPEFLTYLRTDPKFYAKTPEELLGYAALIAKRGDAKLSQYFGLLPRGRFTIIPVPANIAPFYTSGRCGRS